MLNAVRGVIARPSTTFDASFDFGGRCLPSVPRLPPPPPTLHLVSHSPSHKLSSLNPYHSRPSLCIQLNGPACSFERLVKNHDDRQRRLFSTFTLLYFCYIAPIVLSTWHATLSRHSHLVSRSLVTLLHPKSLHCSPGLWPPYRPLHVLYTYPHIQLCLANGVRHPRRVLRRKSLPSTILCLFC